MKVDLRILKGVVFFALVAFGVLFFTRLMGVGKPFAVSAPAALPVVLPEGLGVRVTPSGITLEVAACDIDNLGDEFFLHQYPLDASKAGAEGFINQQFKLQALKPDEIQTQSGVVRCQYRVEFAPFALTRVAIGQFRAPGGHCCDILWNKEVSLDE